MFSSPQGGLVRRAAVLENVTGVEMGVMRRLMLFPFSTGGGPHLRGGGLRVRDGDGVYDHFFFFRRF